MRYKRIFNISAAHFSSGHVYASCWIHDWSKKGLIPYGDVFNMLSCIHGHNFRIEIEIHAPIYERNADWVVDDAELQRIVAEWDGKNLSVHPDFLTPRIRATTENMADILLNKLINKVKGSKLAFTVTVHETDEISASKSAMAPP